MTDAVRLPRPLKTGHGKAFTPADDIPQNFDNGLASIYIGPHRVSGTIHLVSIPFGETILCMPNVPSGRMVPRPECVRPTCGRCILAKEAKERRANANG